MNNKNECVVVSKNFYIEVLSQKTKDFQNVLQSLNCVLNSEVADSSQGEELPCLVQWVRPNPVTFVPEISELIICTVKVG